MRIGLWQKIDRLTCRAIGHDWKTLTRRDGQPDLELCLQCGVIEQTRDLIAELTS